jgi:hypothetical protein
MEVEIKPRPPRVCREEFLKGPIPWAWIREAIVLPGRSLAVGLVIWKEAGWRKQMAFGLTLQRLIDNGIPRDAARRALRKLETAGLISIQSQRGRAAEVTILLPSLVENGKVKPGRPV